MTPDSVKRYSQHGYDLIMEEDPNGKYVKFEDYDRLAKRNRELVAALEKIVMFPTGGPVSRALEYCLQVAEEALKEPESGN